jgi:hypothetical protein
LSRTTRGGSLVASVGAVLADKSLGSGVVNLEETRGAGFALRTVVPLVTDTLAVRTTGSRSGVVVAVAPALLAYLI